MDKSNVIIKYKISLGIFKFGKKRKTRKNAHQSLATIQQHQIQTRMVNLQEIVKIKKPNTILPHQNLNMKSKRMIKPIQNQKRVKYRIARAQKRNLTMDMMIS